MENQIRGKIFCVLSWNVGGGGGNPQDPTNIYKGIINIEMTPFQADNCISRALTLW